MKKLLTVKEVSELLQLNERTVLKMLQSGELPGIRLGAQWRMHPVVLEDWFLRKSQGELETADDKRFPIFDAAHVALDLAAPAADGVLAALIERLVKSGHLMYPDLFLMAVRERESMLSTGVGNGVAIPHARHGVNHLFPEPVVVFGRTRSPIAYAAVDGRPVDLFFLLATPPKEHLPAIALVSQMARQPEILDQLRRVAGPDEAAALLKSVAAPFWPSGWRLHG
jgi:excisionase family DNA binding protein